MGRPRLVQDDKLLSVARRVFVDKGFAASTREIARRAGISEAVIYQRHPTKVDLFFAAMVPPALDTEKLLAAPSKHRGVPDRLEEMALGLMRYFRELMPILVRLMTHPSFNFEKHARQTPDSPLGKVGARLVEFLEGQKRLGKVASRDVEPAILTLIAALHSFAVFEKLGVHGGSFDDATIRAVVRSLWTGLAPAGKSSSMRGRVKTGRRTP